MTDYFVRSSGGSDANDGLSFANGFATIQAGIDAVTTAGDRVLICADGNHSPSAAIDLDSSVSGTQTAPCEIRGANATGVIDGTRPTVIGTSLPASTNLWLLPVDTAPDRWAMRDIISDGDDHALNGLFEDDAGGTRWIFERCRFTQFTRNGISFDQGNFGQFYQCQFDNNGAAGAGASNTGAATRMGGTGWFGCAFHDNGTEGLRLHDRGITVAHCVMFANGTAGLYWHARWGDTSRVLNCVMDGNVDGMVLNINGATTEGGATVMGNIFSNNSGNGVEFVSGAAAADAALVDFNHYHGNGTDRVNFVTGANDTTGDPLYASRTAGSEDFTLGSGSPALNTGIEIFKGAAL